MFDSSQWIADLDVAAACEAVTATQDALREQEWRELALAAQWAVLHDGQTVRDRQRARRTRRTPGAEQVRRAGGPGTPEIAEFACAELAMLMGIGLLAASALIRDAADLCHRHPVLWTALEAGHGRVWKARKVARMVSAAGLTREQTWFRRRRHQRLPGLPAVVGVHPAGGGQDHRGRPRRRRSPATGRRAGTVRHHRPIHRARPEDARRPGQRRGGDLLRGRLRPDRPDPRPARRHRPRRRTPLQGAGDPGQPSRRTRAADRARLRRATPRRPRPVPGRATRQHPQHPQHRTEGRRHGCHGLPERLPPLRCPTRRSRPAPPPGGPVRQDHRGRAPQPHRHRLLRGVGVITAAQAAEFLGHHRVTVRPVVDQRNQVPVTAYEVPTDMAEALRLARLPSVYPWSNAEPHASGIDLDHSKRYVPPERGGPTGQTRPSNLGPMVRFAHRIKTHGRGWRHYQPRPGVYLWRTPHGYWYRVDTTGTHCLGRNPDLEPYRPPPATTPLDRAPRPHRLPVPGGPTRGLTRLRSGAPRR